MAIALIASSAFSVLQSSSSNSFGTTNPVAWAVGDFYVFLVNVNSVSITLTNVTDTAGNAYVTQKGTVGASFTQYIVTCAVTHVSATGANTITAHLSGNTPDSDYNGAGYSGVDAGATVVSNSATGSSATATATITTSYASTAVVGGAFVGNSVTGVGGGATNRITNGHGNNLEDIISSTAGAKSPTATQTASDWVFSIVALQAAVRVPSYGVDDTPGARRRPPAPQNDEYLPARTATASLASIASLGETPESRSGWRPRLPPELGDRPLSAVAIPQRSIAALIEDPSPPQWRNPSARAIARADELPVRPISAASSIGGWAVDAPQYSTRRVQVIDTVVASSLQTATVVHDDTAPRGAWQSPVARARSVLGVDSGQVFDATKPLGSVGALTDDRTRGLASRARTDEPVVLDTTKPLGTLGFTEDSTRGLVRRPFVEDAIPASPARPLATMGFTEDGTRGLVKRPFAEDVSPSSATKPLPSPGWYESDPPLRRWPARAYDDAPVRDLTLAGLLSTGWQPDDAPRPKRWPARAYDDAPVRDVSVVVLPSAGWYVGDAPRGFWRPAAAESVVPTTAIVSALASAGPIQEEPARRPRAPLRPEDGGVVLEAPARSIGWLADAVAPRARVAPRSDEAPPFLATTRGIATFLAVDDAGHVRLRLRAPEDDQPIGPAHVTLPTLGWYGEELRPRAFVRVFFDGDAAPIWLRILPPALPIFAAVTNGALLAAAVTNGALLAATVYHSPEEDHVLPGQGVRSLSTWIDINGAAVDPSGVSFTARMPDGSTVTATPVRDALGAWHADYLVAAQMRIGTVTEIWQSTGSAVAQNATSVFRYEIGSTS